MSNQDAQLGELLKSLDGPQHRYAELDRYYRGDQSREFMAKEAKDALGFRFPMVNVNYIRLAVNAVAERLRVTGFTGADVWPIWLDNNLDQRSALVHREALLTGTGYVSVWANADGSPRIAVESCRQVVTQVDPGTLETIAAVKRWHDDTKRETHAVLYLPDRIERYRANQSGAASSALTLVEVLDNPLGQVPIVAFRNSDLPLDTGVSEVADLVGMVDYLSKLTTDLMVASEYGARPRRWVAGADLVEIPRLDEDGNPVLDVNGDPVADTENPFPETDRMILLEDATAKAGQLPGADLAGYRNAVDVLLTEIAAVSCLPPHYLGAFNHGNPTSADALRASEAGLTAKAEAKQLAFGQSWEQVMRLAQAVATRRAVSGVDIRTRWSDPATRSVAQEADAAQKLYGGQLFSRNAILRRMGMTEDEIAENNAELLAEQRAESYAKADPALMEYNTQFSDNAQFRTAANDTVKELSNG